MIFLLQIGQDYCLTAYLCTIIRGSFGDVHWNIGYKEAERRAPCPLRSAPSNPQFNFFDAIVVLASGEVFMGLFQLLYRLVGVLVRQVARVHQDLHLANQVGGALLRSLGGWFELKKFRDR